MTPTEQLEHCKNECNMDGEMCERYFNSPFFVNGNKPCGYRRCENDTRSRPVSIVPEGAAAQTISYNYILVLPDEIDNPEKESANRTKNRYDDLMEKHQIHWQKWKSALDERERQEICVQRNVVAENKI